MEQTKIKMINQVLPIIGESSVNSIDLNHPDISTIVGIWDEFSNEVQSKGYWYNKEVWQLYVQTDGRVSVPVNVISIDGATTDYIKRGRYLYDLENHSYDFTEATASDLKLDFITEWEITELPGTVFNYILAKVKLKSLVTLAYDQNKEQELLAEVSLRQLLVDKQHLNFSDPNRFNTSAAQQLLTKQPQLR